MATDIADQRGVILQEPESLRRRLKADDPREIIGEEKAMVAYVCPDIQSDRLLE